MFFFADAVVIAVDSGSKLISVVKVVTSMVDAVVTVYSYDIASHCLSYLRPFY